MTMKAGGSLRVMRKTMKWVGSKLRSGAGESIAETLVALLISALALVMLAGAISATARMITVSDKQMGKYYEGDTNLVQQSTSDGTLDITIKGLGTLQEYRNDVNYYKNDAFSNSIVVAYKLPKAP